jgi:NAD(P)-dependent dehydrogenase (short-subunit alcohol dehydrogenase family)
VNPANVVVMGGTAGIGLGVAKRFADQQARVAVVGRGQDRLDEATELLTGHGALGVVGFQCDVRSDDGVATVFDHLSKSWPEVNVLVNAVGPSGQGRFEDMDDDAWLRTFDVGVMSAVRGIRHALPLLRRASWSRIVNITAVSTKHQSPGLIAYTAAKSALASITKNLARTLAPEGILVNAVAPGPVLTSGITGAVRAAGGDPDDVHDAYQVMARQYGSAVDLGRVARPMEIAEAVAFCASRSNTFMTGATLNVDGGSDFC